MSWQYLFHKHEGNIITHLQKAIPAWKNYFPKLSLSTLFSAEKLGLPWVWMTLKIIGEPINLRQLDVIVSQDLMEQSQPM